MTVSKNENIIIIMKKKTDEEEKIKEMVRRKILH